MEEKPEETEHFRMRLDDLDEQIDGRAIPSEVNELRLEKISQRVTMISIMIPVLIVIVLVIAYLDIKKRVVQTEDSGTIEFRKLSSDLESRFSTLSLRQAKLEDTLEKLTAQNDHAMASTQVRMEKLHDAIEQIRKGALGVKELEAVKQDLVKQINGVIESTNSMIESTHEAGKQNTATLQDLKSQVIQQAERQAAMNTRIADAQKNYADLESRKIDKQSLDLALRLEALKVETAVKTQIDGLQQKLNALERQLSQLSSRATPGTPTPARPAPAPTAPTPAPAAPAAPSGTPSPSGNDLETHTITPR